MRQASEAAQGLADLGDLFVAQFREHRQAEDFGRGLFAGAAGGGAEGDAALVGRLGVNGHRVMDAGGDA